MGSQVAWPSPRPTGPDVGDRSGAGRCFRSIASRVADQLMTRLASRCCRQLLRIFPGPVRPDNGTVKRLEIPFRHPHASCSFFLVDFLAKERELTGKTFTTPFTSPNPNIYVKFIFPVEFPFNVWPQYTSVLVYSNIGWSTSKNVRANGRRTPSLKWQGRSSRTLDVFCKILAHFNLQWTRIERKKSTAWREELFEILSPPTPSDRMGGWFFRLTCLTLVCQVTRYRLVHIRQKRKVFSGWRLVIAFLYLFLFHSLLCLTYFLSQNMYKNQS